MYTRKVGLVARRNFVPPLCCVRLKHDPPSKVPDNYYDPDAIHENPLVRSKRFFKRDFDSLVRKLKNPLSRTDLEDSKNYPKTVDILIVGGGVIGSSIAYWIQNKCRDGITIAVVEKDLSVNKTFSPEEVLKLN